MLAIVVVGILVNFVCYGIACNKEQEGGMGTAFVIPFLFIPWIAPVAYVVIKAVEYFGWGK